MVFFGTFICKGQTNDSVQYALNVGGLYIPNAKRWYEGFMSVSVVDRQNELRFGALSKRSNFLTFYECGLFLEYRRHTAFNMPVQLSYGLRIMPYLIFNQYNTSGEDITRYTGEFMGVALRISPELGLQYALSENFLVSINGAISPTLVVSHNDLIVPNSRYIARRIIAPLDASVMFTYMLPQKN